MSDMLLVCAATAMELRAFQRDGEPGPLEGETPLWPAAGALAVAVTGVGIPCTMLTLPPLLASVKPNLVLNIGIAGAYPNSGLAIGDVVMARSEVFGDVGFELPDEPRFRSVSEAPFGGFYRPLPMSLAPAFRHAPARGRFAEAAGCTVNSCTGTLGTGLLRERLFGAQTESMEGAAVALACQAAGVPACEVRAISNVAGERSISAENIQLALLRLAEYLHACRERAGI